MYDVRCVMYEYSYGMYDVRYTMYEYILMNRDKTCGMKATELLQINHSVLLKHKYLSEIIYT